MKIIFKMKILIVIVAVLLLGACSKELNISPLDSITSDAVWKDKVLTKGFLTGVVNSSVSLWVNQPTDQWTDNCIMYEAQAGSQFQVQLGEITADNINAGWNQFGNIRKVNLFLSKIEEKETAALFNEGEKNAMIAEAKVARAMIYFWLARRYGGYIILNKPLSPEDELELPRNSEEEVYAFIVSDLEAAFPNLPASASEKFRITAGAAHALMTLVGIQYPNKYYDKVITSTQAIEGMGYSLDNYFNVFNTFEGLKSSPEVILSWARALPNGITLGGTLMSGTLNNIDWARHAGLPDFPAGFSYIAYAIAFPSQELIDAYLFKDNGNPIQRKGTEFEGSPADNMWKDRDDRFEQSIMHDNGDVFGAKFNFKLGGNQQKGMPGVGNPSFSGYFFKKWLYESVTHGISQSTPTINWGEPIFRLGEVYLNAAEAYARKNDLSDAVKFLNKTRTSHGGLAPLTATNMVDFWKYYKLERRVEMVYEDDRYWSLIRWSRADSNAPINELNGYLTFINLYQYADGLVRIKSTEGGDYRGPLSFEIPKRYFFPIPISEIQNNENLKQNPGY